MGRGVAVSPTPAVRELKDLRYPADPLFAVADLALFAASVRERCAAHASVLGRALDLVESSWSGVAGDAAAAALREFRRCLDRAMKDLTAVPAALDDYADAVAWGRRVVDGLRTEFDAHWPKATINEPCVNNDTCYDHLDRLAALKTPELAVHVEMDSAAQVCMRVLREAMPDRAGLPVAPSSPIGALPRDWLGDLFRTTDEKAHEYVWRVRGLSPAELGEWLDWVSAEELHRICSSLSPEERAAFASHLLRWADPLFFAKIHRGMPETLPDPGDSVGWAEPTGTLFPTDDANHRWIDDVNQQGYGNCSFAATLAGVVAADAAWARNHVQRNSNGTVTVTLYDEYGPVPVTVSADLPTGDGSDPFGLWSHRDTHLDAGPSWPGYVEKALAQYFQNRAVGGGSYRGIESQWMRDVGPYLTGRSSFEVDSIAQAVEALEAGHAVTLSTLRADEVAFANEGLGTLAYPHAYTLTKVEDGMYHLRNPWGIQHPKPMTADQVARYFGHLTVAELR